MSGDEVGVPVELRDGSRVRIRQGRRTDRECWRIRQGRRTDRELLVRGFEHLGAESRYRRFLTPMHALGPRIVRDMTELDDHDHEAMIALDQRGAEGLGDAFYVRDSRRPDTAEVAVTVVDDWQGRGLGRVRVVRRAGGTVEIEVAIPASSSPLSSGSCSASRRPVAEGGDAPRDQGAVGSRRCRTRRVERARPGRDRR